MPKKNKATQKKPNRAQPVPKGFHSVTPYLAVKGAAGAIDFYVKAFGAKVLNKMPGPDGQSVMHAEMRIGDSVVMVSDTFPGSKCQAPATLGGTTTNIHVYVKDVDAAFERALQAGATVDQPVQDMFWGDRYGKVIDPFGHSWALATHKEDLSPKEMAKRAAEAFSKMPS